ncbi:MAG: hypothetical protein J6S67_17170 [Methanobrevibacter sp.]|nr:hypothetical protein [Methanobrevibacter sp.]
MKKAYVVAKAIKGQEYLYNRNTVLLIPSASAQLICDSLNSARYQLKDGEVWHLFERDWYTEQLAVGKAYKRKNKVYIDAYVY